MLALLGCVLAGRWQVGFNPSARVPPWSEVSQKLAYHPPKPCTRPALLTGILASGQEEGREGKVSRRGKETEKGAEPQGEGRDGSVQEEGGGRSPQHPAHSQRSSGSLIPENSLLNGQPACLSGLYVVI